MWSIDSKLPIQLAVIRIAGVSVAEHKKAFERLSDCASDYKRKYAGSAIGEIQGVQDARRLFRAIGIDPTKHRPASEALLNRALKDKELYSINTLVDVGNWCALDFLLPTCVYDADKIKGDVIMRKGAEGESYLGLNSRPVNVHNRYLLADESGAFGSPMRDSQRSAVTLDTKKTILLIYAPLDYNLEMLKEKAQLFARRTQDICGGSLEDIMLLKG
ncbi:MAG: hypothetical protein JW869_00810 [Candidatus Omnitrophica bacterium]|nr:hypothetical protein [Candidatus Omnitrophota bacterium]